MCYVNNDKSLLNCLIDIIYRTCKDDVAHFTLYRMLFIIVKGNNSLVYHSYRFLPK